MIQERFYWITLALGVLVYWLAPPRLRPWALAAVSIGYVARLDAVIAGSLMLWILAFYYLGRIAVERRGTMAWLVPALIVAILSYLGHFKYLPVLLHEFSSNANDAALALVVPLGISYFTFKLIHYAVETRRQSLPTHGFGDFLAYMFMFPIYTAGPIERFDHFMRNRAEAWRHQDLLEGALRIAYGLIKKFVVGGIVLIWIRDSFAGGDVEELLGSLDAIHPIQVWLFVITAYLLIYMDFSAYSDIAIGSSRLFGIRIMENFNFPVVAPNIGNFWKRWHMTLAGWCQSYIYMPTIALTRNPYVAVLATFTAIGLWHAASVLWLLWGLYHAIGVMLFLTWARWQRKLRRKPSKGLAAAAASRVGTFLFVAASFSFTSVYGHGTSHDALRILARLVGINLA